MAKKRDTPVTEAEGETGGDGRPVSAQEVLDQHEFAKTQYHNFREAADEVEDLITNQAVIERDVADDGPVQVTRPILSRAIIERFRQMIPVDVRSVTHNVMPRAQTDSEEAACTKLERYLRGLDARYQWEAQRNIDRDALWWYLFRGRVVYEQRLRPEFAGTNRFPIDQIVDDPYDIFTIRGRRGLLWYTKEYYAYGRELRRDLAGKASEMPEAARLYLDDLDDTDEVCCTEYVDDEYYALVLGEDHLVMSRKHGYGFVPAAEARCMDTPMASQEWASQSVIAPVTEHIRQLYTLASKIATGVNFAYFPMMYYISADGTPVVFDPSNPGVLKPRAPDSRVEVIPVTLNSQIIAQLMAFFKGDISLMTLPETAFGSEPKSLESGFAISQVLNQVKSSITDKLPNMEMAMALHRSNILRIIEKFSVLDELDFGVVVEYD